MGTHDFESLAFTSIPHRQDFGQISCIDFIKFSYLLNGRKFLHGVYLKASCENEVAWGI